MIVLAIDPGLASGVALINSEGTQLLGSWELEEFATTEAVEKSIETYGADWDLRIVVERFTINAETAKKSQAPWSLMLIGSIRYVCYRAGIPEPALQTPADAKNFAPNARLKNLGLWHTGGHGHALDAIRHGVLYMARNGWKDSRLLQD